MKNLFIVLTILLVLLSCGEKEVFYIGLVGTETGDDNTKGIGAYNGVKLAIELLKKKDFKPTGKHELHLIHYDDEGNPERALSLIKRLMEKDNVCAVILSSNIGALSNEAIELAEENEIPLLSIANNYESTTPSPFVYEYSPDRIQYTEKTVNAIKSKLNLKRACYIKYHPEETIGLTEEPQVPVFISNLIEITHSITLKPNNLLDVVLTIRGYEDIDAVLFDGPPDKVIKFNGKCLEKGFIKPVIYARMMEMSSFTEKELNMMKGLYFFSPITEDTDNPELLSFIQSNYENRGVNPSVTTTLSYEATYAVINAIKLANSTNRKIIAKKIVEMEPVMGVLAHTPRKADDTYKIYIQQIIPFQTQNKVVVINEVE
ncbi:MAG TPA: amino acid ABC transporter substrate-binding protein [Firmicutes bacterium]|nr:amino acid ABC transporter substrate-binding protein [Bacillota bacterium]